MRQNYATEVRIVEITPIIRDDSISVGVKAIRFYVYSRFTRCAVTSFSSVSIAQLGGFNLRLRVCSAVHSVPQIAA